MILSRGVALRKLTSHVANNLVLKNSKNTVYKQIARCHIGGLRYRTYPDPSERKVPLSYEILGSIIWWWILWHLFTDYQELLGPSLPDPSKFTDEELGVPPEDED